MDILLKAVLDAVMTNPVVQGALVSLLVARLRVWFKTLDMKATDPNQVHIIHLIVMGMAMASTLLAAYSQHKLESVDTQTIVNFVQAVVAALGTHQLGKDIKAAVNVPNKS